MIQRIPNSLAKHNAKADIGGPWLTEPPEDVMREIPYRVVWRADSKPRIQDGGAKTFGVEALISAKFPLKVPYRVAIEDVVD